MMPTGKGRRKILVVAEAPGVEEDRKGTQLIGKSGQRLRRALKKFGVDLDRDCWKTNAVTCYPGGTPTDNQVIDCRPSLLKCIDELKPETIILLGAKAVKSLVGHLWREEVGSIGRWVGWKIPCREYNAWICPTWHPSYLLRSGNDVLDLWFDKHLENAVGLKGRPSDGAPPDYEGQVQVVRSPEEAARLIRTDGWRREGLTAFDFETNMLKPDSPRARIVSCAIAFSGGWTIAFPFEGDAVGAVGEYLRGPQPKVAANLKFEDRWSRKVFGHRVRNWRWDTMVNAHVLDNRRGITSLAFQSFARFGIGDYGSRVSPYLKAKGSNELNNIHKCDMGELLLYNGMDARLELEVAKLQMEEMGETNER